MPIESNAALEAAVIADAHSDVPRLVYADWLDEHGDPVRAEFIRVQCRLHEVSPADEEWIDLTERQAELIEILQATFANFPDIPKELEPHTHFTASAYAEAEIAGGRFQRGFPYFVDHRTPSDRPGPLPHSDDFAEFLRLLPRLTAATALRGLEIDDLNGSQIARLLDDPAFQQFTGLKLGGVYTPREENLPIFEALAAGAAGRNLETLILYKGVPAKEARALTATKTLANVRRLMIQGIVAPPADVAKLVAGPVFQNVRHFGSLWLQPKQANPLLAGLAKLPHLHTLEMQAGGQLARAARGKGKFPALARVIDNGNFDADAIHAFARAKLPSLRVLDVARGGMKNDEFEQLVACPWVGQLLALKARSHKIGDKGVLALANHPVAATLRALYLGDNAFGKKGLLALGTKFPRLTTLHLGSYLKRRATEADVAEFLSKVELPRLRALDLMNWPIGPAGAKALAANPSFANLSRLGLCDCKVGDAGAKALLASPHLGNLRSLNLENNGVTKAAEGFLKAGALPGLRYLDLRDNKLPKAVRAKFYDTDQSFVVRLPRD